MKRCPDCEFIYEDDQSYCDMDGTKLAYDSRSLPKLQALSATEANSDSRWKSRAVPVFASALLAIVLGFVYYVSTRQAAPAVNNSEPAPIEQPATAAEPTPLPTAAETSSQATDSNPPTEEKSSSSESASETKKQAEPRVNNSTASVSKPVRARTQQEEAKESGEKDNKVRSIIKKTGRFFKKAF